MTSLVLFLRDNVKMSKDVKASLARIGFVSGEYHDTVHSLEGEIEDNRIEDLKNHESIQWIEEKIVSRAAQN